VKYKTVPCIAAFLSGGYVQDLCLKACVRDVDAETVSKAWVQGLHSGTVSKALVQGLHPGTMSKAGFSA